MKLADVFPPGARLRPLLEKANVHDEAARFAAAAGIWPGGGSVLLPHVLKLSSSLDDACGFGEIPRRPAGLRPVLAGQQPYIDYLAGMLAKLAALEACGEECAGFFGFAEYDLFGSDRLISRTDVPRLDRAPKADPVYRLHFYPGWKRQGQKDLRFVPPPEPATLDHVRSVLKGTVTCAFRCSPLERRRALERLGELMDDYEQARRSAGHAAGFNMAWSLRQIRRLGFRAPVVPLGELFARPELIPSFAETLSVFVRENGLFVESIAEALEQADGFDVLFQSKEPGYLPLFLTDRATGLRVPLRLRRRGTDFLLAAPEIDTEESVGSGGASELEPFLLRYAGLWTPNVFLPVFLFRLGLAGLVNGKGSIRYSLVVAHVMDRLFGLRHPPNLLCAGRLAPCGPLAGAARDLEPGLVSLLLTEEPEEIRRRIEEVWR